MLLPLWTLTLLRGFTSVTLKVPIPLIFTLSPSMSAWEIVANSSRRKSSQTRLVVEVDSAIN